MIIVFLKTILSVICHFDEGEISVCCSIIVEIPRASE